MGEKQEFTPEDIQDARELMDNNPKAMRVGQTWESYNTKRSVEVQKNREKRESKDRESANEIRKQLELPAVGGKPEAFPSQGVEKKIKKLAEYFALPNVKVAEKKLGELLSNGKFTKESVKQVLYDMLTTRSEYQDMLESKNGNLVELLDQFKDQRTKYNSEIRVNLAQKIDADPNMKWESNPGWFGINTRPEAPKQEGVDNKKIYKTIPMDQPGFVEHLPTLATELRKLSVDTDDIIQVKVPENFAAFISKNDSLVVHFKNRENTQAIEKCIQDWMRKNGITDQPREMGRAVLAADVGKSSFSDLVADNIATWMESNKDTTDPKTLIRLGMEHTIKQAGTSNVTKQ